jgi:arylsulfatase A-like enzyme
MRTPNKITSRMRVPDTALALFALTTLFCLTTITCTSGHESQPNVILVMTDDQGYGDIGAHGSPYVKTPTLDRLYGETVRLTDFHVDPCCSPTRAALLTGQYSARTGVWHTIGGRSLLRNGKVTIADVFQAGGYKTAIFGKWHLGDNYPFRPQDRGFEEVLVHGSGVVGNRWDYWENDYYDDTYYRNGQPEKFQGYCNTIWFDEAIQFLEKNRDQRFFCFLSTNVPHAPLNVDDSYIEPYRSQVSEQLASYYGMITKFDEDMARLLAAIDELDLTDNTILIFMTDNGPCPWYGGIKIDENGFVEEGYSAGMRGGKIWGYENAHRVPFYIRWPAQGIGGGKDLDQLLSHIDLLPTLIDMCGLEKPGQTRFDGRSFLPLLIAPQADWEERTLFVHNQRVDFPVKYKEYQVLTERWRLVKRKSDELYDIQADPGQRNDIADRHPEVVASLRQEYEVWWEDVSQDFNIYDQTIIGSDFENPTPLYSHDAHSVDQKKVFVIDVARDGQYAFRLFRWPREAQKTIGENRAGEQVFPAHEANLNIGNLVQTSPVTADTMSIEFVAHLKAGTTCLQAWFEDEAAEKRIFADFVYVERQGPANPEALETYRPSDPDSLLRPGSEK